MPRKPLPPRLYKYQPFNAQTLENLTHRSVWFSAPTDLNDPYDCDLAGIDPAKLTEADFQLALDHMQPELTPEQGAAPGTIRKCGVHAALDSASPSSSVSGRS